MVNQLDNSNETIANKIFTIFQRSYRVEAQLIGIIDFPPLLRNVDDIKHAKTLFYGFSDNQRLTAVIEIAIEDKYLDIHSLTVDPNHFRKGIAHKLMRNVLDTIDFSEAIVETAAVNIPAINLYEKHGFVESKRWTPSHGIPKVAMSLECTQPINVRVKNANS